MTTNLSITFLQGPGGHLCMNMELQLDFNIVNTLSVLFILLFDFTKAIECPTENDIKCKSFWHQLLIYPGKLTSNFW